MDVLIVGAGPAGLTAALVLASAGAGSVEVLEREQRPGGVPRHCDHGGFGSPWTSGPRFAAQLTSGARVAGARVRTSVTATAWAGPRTLDVTGPGGLERIAARAVVLATGARERPCPARLVPGTRPSGIWTTGELQQVTHGPTGLRGPRLGTRAVVVGAEPVAYAALATLRRAGVPVVAQITEEAGRGWLTGMPRRAARTRLGAIVPLLTDTTVSEVLGHGRLTGVRLRHESGRTTQVPCDTLVFTGEFVPDHELARHAGLRLDPGTRGPAVDGTFRTAEPGVFAVGNVLHAVEPATVAAAEGAAAAGAVLRQLADPATDWPTTGPELRVASPLRWVTPNRMPVAGPLTVRADGALGALRGAVVVVEQDGRVLHRERVGGFGAAAWQRGRRTFRVKGEWSDRVDPAGGAVVVGLA